MIRVHRLNGDELIVNADLIETIESTPDTVISLTTGRQFVVLDNVDDLIEQAIAFRAKISALGRAGAGVDLNRLIELGNEELKDS